MKSKAASLSGDCSPAEAFERDFVQPHRGRTLIVGSQVYREKEDRRKRYPDATGVDMLAGPGVDVVANLEEALPDLGLFAHIECMSVLEHSRRPWLLAANLERLLVRGGSIFVTVPFCWRYHGYPDDFWRFTVQGIGELFPSVEWKAAAYVHRDITADQKRLPIQKIGGFPYLPRTEVMAFGLKRL